MVDATYGPKVYRKSGGDTMIVASGGILNVETGGKIQNNGVDLDLSSGIATSTTSTTAELNTLHSVTAGTAAASSAVVLDASKGVVGLGQVGAQKVMTAIAVDGACAIAPKIVMLTKAGACAVTLADPTSGTDDGTEITFIAQTANAHTVSNAAGSGFNGAGASKDVATFGGAVGDGFTVVAYLGKWYTKGSLTNVTLG